MTDQKDKAFHFADLSQYSLKQRLLIRIIDLIFYLAIRLLGSLSRFEVRGWENFEAIEAAGHKPIYAFWHDQIFMATYYFRKYGIVVMTSKSFDGEYIARFIQRLGYGSIRGSSSRGGAKALVEMIKTMRMGHPMGFTVDGPRGPRHVAKPGPVMLAKKTGNPIMPFLVESKSAWTAKSWDRLQIPRPFSPSIVIIGRPIYVPSDATGDETNAKVTELQSSLDDLVKDAETWRTSKT